MAYNPGVTFFIPFHYHDPSKQTKCIFFTLKGARCRWSCQESDNRRAIALHRTILAISSEAVSLDLLQEYILCNCCRSGNAQHRDRMVDIGLLLPLAQRWQDEIRRHAAEQSSHTPSVPALGQRISLPGAYPSPATPSPSYTTAPYTPIASPSYWQSNTRTSSSFNATPSTSVASSSFYQHDSPRPSITTEFAFQPVGSQPRYDLRPREAIISTNSTTTRHTPISPAALSEFRPHVAEPRASDSVSGKILDPLIDRDFETGSLYIFNRAASPGHVKIGWTARPVPCRLEELSKCGYTPNLLFSVHDVPHAQRVETLTHYELIKEWRRERRCRAPWCLKSHREWFEISNERAAQVLGDWAEFMKKAEPYDSNGSLKKRWREVGEKMNRNGEGLTAQKLLELYDASLVEAATLVEKPVELGHAPKIKDEADFGYGPKVGRQRAPEVLPKQTPPVKISLPKAEKQPKSDSLFTRKPLPKTEPLFSTEPRPSPQFLFPAESPFKLEPLSKTNPPTKESPFTPESLLRTEPLWKTKPPTKESPFTPESLFRTEPLWKTNPPNKKESPFTPESLFRTEPLWKTNPPNKKESPFTPESLFRTEPLWKTKPPFKTESLFTTELSFKTESLFETEPTFKTESLFTAESLFKTLPPPENEEVHEEVLALERTPVKKELLPGQIPLPPLPFLQSTTLPEDTLSSQETKPSPSTGTQEASAVHIISNSDTDITAVDASSNLGINSSVSPSVPASLSPITSPTATPSEDSPQTDTHTSTDTITTNFSDPPSEPNPSESPATSTSPKSKAEPVSSPSTLLVTEVSETLLSLSIDEQEALAQTLTLITQRQPNVGGDVRAGPEREPFGCDRQTREEETTSHDQGESTTLENERDTRADDWDVEATLVEDQTPMPVEKAAWKLIDGLYNDISTGQANDVLQGFDGLKVLESEAPPAVEVVVQA